MGELRGRVAAIAGGIAVAVMAVGVLTWGCRGRGTEGERPQPAPSSTATARAGRTPASAPAGPAGAPAGSTAPAERRGAGAAPVTGPIATAPPRDALAPAHVAPALGLVLDPATRLEVDPLTGVATLLETDASLPLGLGLRRARSGDADGQGLFGRGWRSEADATLHALPGGGLAARRADGVVVYQPVREGLWASTFGDVELLVRTDEGYEVRDPAGRLHRFDAAGRLVELLPGFRVERAEGELLLVGGVATITLTLDRDGRAVRASGPGVDLAFDYAGGELVAVSGSRTRRYAVAAGRLAEVRGERAPLLRLEHDADTGCIARAHVPAFAPAWTQTYRFDDGLAEVSTPRGTWCYELEAEGWLVRSPAGVERIPLDARGRIVAPARTPRPRPPLPAEVETPAGRRFTFERDAQGNATTITTPVSRLEIERDAQGRRKSVRDAVYGVSAFRDKAGRVASLLADDGTAIDFVLRDDAGRIVQVVPGVFLGWDAQGRLTSDRYPYADVQVEYAHEPGVERATTPWGQVARVRDAEGRVVRVDSPAGTFRYELDEHGRRVAVTYPNGVTTRFTRGTDGRAATIAASGRAGPVLRLDYERGEDGRILSVTRDGETTRLGHDQAGRLISAGARRWTVDADGVRAEAREELEHDASGRLVRRTRGDLEHRYAYDGFGRLRLAKITHRDGASCSVSYAYDGLGRPIEREVDCQGRTFLVYERGQRLAEVGPGERVRLWIHGPGTDEPLAYRDSVGDQVGPWVYLHADVVGSVLAYTDERGARIDAVELDPFGEVLVAPAVAERPLVFAGRPIDPDTGLVDLRARVYVPSLGRFLEPDPAGLRGGPAPHVYADGRPLELRDPLGLWPWSDDEELEAGQDPAEPAPSVLESARVRLLCWLTGAGLDGLRKTSAALDAGAAVARDFRVGLIRNRLVDQAGVDRPHFSTSAAVNFFHDSVAPLYRDVADATEGAFGLARDLVSPDVDASDASAAARAFGEGYRDAALGYGKAIERGQRRYERIFELYHANGDTASDAFAMTANLALLETFTPVVPMHELRTGRDFETFLETGNERRLSSTEKYQRAVRVASEVAAAVAGVAASRLRQGTAALDEVEDLARAARNADAPPPPPARPQPPRDGLAQAVSPDTPRGNAGQAAAGDVAAAEAPKASPAAAGGEGELTPPATPEVASQPPAQPPPARAPPEEKPRRKWPNWRGPPKKPKAEPELVGPPEPPPFPVAPDHAVVNALKGVRGRDFRFGPHTFKLEKRGLKHILQRHHPKYWDGSVKQKQSFFDARMTLDDIQAAIEAVLQQNRARLAQLGTRGEYQVRGVFRGQEYVLGLNRGRVAQFYPPQ